MNHTAAKKIEIAILEATNYVANKLKIKEYDINKFIDKVCIIEELRNYGCYEISHEKFLTKVIFNYLPYYANIVILQLSVVANVDTEDIVNVFYNRFKYKTGYVFTQETFYKEEGKKHIDLDLHDITEGKSKEIEIVEEPALPIFLDAENIKIKPFENFEDLQAKYFKVFGEMAKDLSEVNLVDAFSEVFRGKDKNKILEDMQNVYNWELIFIRELEIKHLLFLVPSYVPVLRQHIVEVLS